MKDLHRFIDAQSFNKLNEENRNLKQFDCIYSFQGKLNSMNVSFVLCFYFVCESSSSHHEKS